MMASLGNFKTLKISDARKNRRRTISEIENFKNGPVSAVSIYFYLFKNNNQLLAPTCGALVWCKIIFSESIG